MRKKKVGDLKSQRYKNMESMGVDFSRCVLFKHLCVFACAAYLRILRVLRVLVYCILSCASCVCSPICVCVLCCVARGVYCVC